MTTPERVQVYFDNDGVTVLRKTKERRIELQNMNMSRFRDLTLDGTRRECELVEISKCGENKLLSFVYSPERSKNGYQVHCAVTNGPAFE